MRGGITHHHKKRKNGSKQMHTETRKKSKLTSHEKETNKTMTNKSKMLKLIEDRVEKRCGEWRDRESQYTEAVKKGVDIKSCYSRVITGGHEAFAETDTLSRVDLLNEETRVYYCFSRYLQEQLTLLENKFKNQIQELEKKIDQSQNTEESMDTKDSCHADKLKLERVLDTAYDQDSRLPLGILVKFHRDDKEYSEVAVVKDFVADCTYRVALGSLGQGEVVYATSRKIDVVAPKAKERVKVIHGDYHGKTGKLILVDNHDAVVKMDESLAFIVFPLRNLAREAG